MNRLPVLGIARRHVIVDGRLEHDLPWFGIGGLRDDHLAAVHRLEHTCHGDNRIALADSCYEYPRCVPPCSEIASVAVRTRFPADENRRISSPGTTVNAATTRPPGLRDPHAPYPLAAPTLTVERRESSPLAVAARRDEQEHGVVASHVGAHNAVISVLELHSTHTCGRATIGRTSSSENLIVMPCCDTMKTSSFPLVWITRTSSSPPLRLIAMRPIRSDESYSDIRVFTCPCRLLVAEDRYEPSSYVQCR